MSLQCFYNTLKNNKYFTNKHIFHKYETDIELKTFIITLDNILDDIYNKKFIGIRYSEQKTLLEILNFILNTSKLYKIEMKFIEGNYYLNNYHNKPVGPREALIASLIYELNKNLGEANKTSYNICIDFISSYSYELHKHNLDISKIKRKINNEITFCGKYKLGKEGSIDSEYYL